MWPKRWRRGVKSHRHRITIRFGPAIRPLPGEHRNQTMARVQAWFDEQDRRVSATPPAAPVDETAGERRVAAVTR
jgi:hypothetical protein